MYALVSFHNLLLRSDIFHLYHLLVNITCLINWAHKIVTKTFLNKLLRWRDIDSFLRWVILQRLRAYVG